MFEWKKLMLALRQIRLAIGLKKWSHHTNSADCTIVEYICKNEMQIDKGLHNRARGIKQFKTK